MISETEIKNSTVRALTWKQPYADLMLKGKQETRTWKTNYRGLVLICAAKKSYNQTEIVSISGALQAARILQLTGNTGITGKAIAIGRLTGCRFMQKHDENDAFVKHRNELYLWEFDEVQKIKPFEWSGVQGWKTLTQDEKNLIVPIYETANSATGYY